MLRTCSTAFEYKHVDNFNQRFTPRARAAEAHSLWHTGSDQSPQSFGMRKCWPMESTCAASPIPQPGAAPPSHA
jgi:hypothetical protein